MSKGHYNKSELKEYEKIEKTCKQCGTKFYKTWSKWTLSDFCCQKCARAYSTSSKRAEINKKVSEKLKTFHEGLTKEEYREKFLKNKRQNRRCKNGVMTSEENKTRYYSSPKVCPECGVTFDTESKRVKFCSHSCSVKYNSRKRIGKQNNCRIRTGITPEGFVAIPKLDGYFINNEKKVWSNAKGGHFMRLYNMRGRRNKYNIKNAWYTPDELFNMTFNK